MSSIGDDCPATDESHMAMIPDPLCEDKDARLVAQCSSPNVGEHSVRLHIDGDQHRASPASSTKSRISRKCWYDFGKNMPMMMNEYPTEPKNWTPRPAEHIVDDDSCITGMWLMDNRISCL